MEKGRVVSKHTSFPSFFFFDILKLTGEVVSVLVYKSKKFPFVHVGDVIAFSTETELNDKSLPCLVVSHLVLVENWCGFGPFQWRRGTSVIPPNLVAVIQAQDDVLARVTLYLEENMPQYQYCESSTPVSKSQDRLLLVSGTDGAKICDFVINNTSLAYAVSRVYLLGPSPMIGFTVADIAEKIGSIDISMPFCRVHSFPPRCLDLTPLEQSEVLTFSPTRFSHVISLVYVNGVFCASLMEKSLAIGAGAHIGRSGRPSDFISKASAKLVEAYERLEFYSQSSSSRKGSVAIDIGASPGGWSAYLVNHFERVIAVDKGEIDARLVPRVEHWAMRGQEAIEKLLAEKNLTINCFVCDMNCDLTDTVELFVSALPLLAPSFRGVITFKQTVRNKKEWAEMKKLGIETISKSLPKAFVKEVHLIANTPKETTILIWT